MDTILRNGSHVISHSFTIDQVRTVAEGLDRAGVDLVEPSHGDGIDGSSISYGLSIVDELTLLRAVGEVIENAKLTVLPPPGIGTIEDLKRVEETGIGTVRMVTHVTRADVSIQHIRYAKSEGLFVVGFLMMSRTAEPKKVVEQARIFEAEGIDYTNLTGSVGCMLSNDVRRCIAALEESISVPIEFRAHDNVGLVMGSSLAALETRAEYLDGTCRGLGAGAGGTWMEVLCTVLNRMGYNIHADIYQMMNMAQTTVEPLMHHPQAIRMNPLMLKYAGVYSSFLFHARRAAKQFGINIKDILVELGRRGVVGGQEDMIADVAYELSKNRF